MLNIHGLNFFINNKALINYLYQSEIILDSDYNCPECGSYYPAIYYFSGGTNSCKKCNYKNLDLETTLNKLKSLGSLLNYINHKELFHIIGELDHYDIVSEKRFSYIIHNIDDILDKLEYIKLKNA